MANLKDLRNRIASVKATQKITKAMQMVAAAKLRRAQEAAEAARPVCSAYGRVLANLPAMAGSVERAKAVGGHRLRIRPILLIVQPLNAALRWFQLVHRQAGAPCRRA